MYTIIERHIDPYAHTFFLSDINNSKLTQAPVYHIAGSTREVILYQIIYFAWRAKEFAYSMESMDK